MATYFPTQNGRIQIQAETLLGTNPEGWVYQAPGTGNNVTGAQGGYYFFQSETDDGSVKNAIEGRFDATIQVTQAGFYTLRVRTARDTNDPGDSRNDLWARIDGDMRSVLPDGTVPIETTWDGYAKLKGASMAWGYARTLSALHEEDESPGARVYLTEGFHTISFAGRSVGLHIDFFELVRDGVNVGPDAPNTGSVTDGDPDAAADSATTTAGAAVAIAVLANDSDPDGTSIAINAFDAASASGGTVTKAGNQLVYTPAAGFTGSDSFTYDVIDPTGRVSDRATVTIAVTDQPGVITGTDAADVLEGRSTADVIRAGAGDDTITGFGGADRIHGQDGLDQVYAGPGNDVVSGGAGNDQILGQSGNDRLAGDTGDDYLNGGPGNDVIDGGAGNDTADGGTGDDRIWGGDGDDVVRAAAGNDWMAGGAGADVLAGGSGADTLFGEAGADVLSGGGGADVLAGGADADRFVYTAGRDRIADFTRGEDLIDLRAIDGLESFADLAAHASRDGTDLVLAFGPGQNLRVEDIRFFQLDADDFIL